MITHVCDGLGGCQANAPVSCGGQYCSGGSCIAKKDDGVACSLPSECLHGNCISNGSTSICCSTGCADTPCVTKALCNPGGSGCQAYQDNDPCSAGSARCSPDGHSSLAATGTCVSGSCNPTETPCTPYLCVGTSCQGLGQCSTEVGCDTNYSCVAGSCQ